MERSLSVIFPLVSQLFNHASGSIGAILAIVDNMQIPGMPSNGFKIGVMSFCAAFNPQMHQQYLQFPMPI